MLKTIFNQNFFKNNKGFTLIELLIVIVIVGILAGVLIAVIDPVKQQNRSRNAAIKSSITKVSFAINAAKSGLGTLPDEVALSSELNNITTLTSECDTPDTLDCAYTISGTILPETCNTGSVDSLSYGSGSSSCYFGIVSTGAALRDGDFRVYGKKFKLNGADPDEVFVFDSSLGLYLCDASVAGSLDLDSVCTLED